MTNQIMQISSLLLGAALTMTACGGPEEEDSQAQQQADSASAAASSTAYGSVEEVSSYLVSIDPFIREVSAIQVGVDTLVGSAGKGTGANLAPAAGDARQRLNQLLDDLAALEPPPLLAPLHRDIKRLITLRLEAYTSTVRGWEIEQSGGDFRAQYDAAQGKYSEANDVIVALNGELEKIHQAVLAASAGG